MVLVARVGEAGVGVGHGEGQGRVKGFYERRRGGGRGAGNNY